MRKYILMVVFALSLVTVAHAQIDGGDNDGPCTDSPENPTLVLAALGSGGAALAALRVRMAAGKKKR